MSMIHLRTRKQAIQMHKDFTQEKKIRWNINGKLLEVTQPKESPGCFESTKHHGVYFDGEEVIQRGILGKRVGFIRDDHHYQVLHWGFNFTHTKARSKNGKFILVIDGWEAETGISVNKFFKSMYLRVLIFGILLLVLSVIGIVAIAFVKNPIASSMLSRTFLIFLPLSFYYLYVGFIGTVKFNSRVKLDEAAEPWWSLEGVVPPKDSDGNGATATTTTPITTDVEAGTRGSINNTHDDDDDNDDDYATNGNSTRARVLKEPGLDSVSEQPFPQRPQKLIDSAPLIAFD